MRETGTAIFSALLLNVPFSNNAYFVRASALVPACISEHAVIFHPPSFLFRESGNAFVHSFIPHRDFVSPRHCCSSQSTCCYGGFFLRHPYTAPEKKNCPIPAGSSAQCLFFVTISRRFLPLVYFPEFLLLPWPDRTFNFERLTKAVVNWRVAPSSILRKPSFEGKGIDACSVSSWLLFATIWNHTRRRPPLIRPLAAVQSFPSSFAR